MFKALRMILRPSSSDSLAKAFSRLGWLGLWIQVVIGSIPLLLISYSVVFGHSTNAGTRSRLLLIEYLAFASLLVLAFNIVWSYRYTRLAARIADTTQRPTVSVIQRTAWIGVTASTLGIVFSMFIMLFEVAHLLVYFLRAPQAGVPVIQTTGGGQATWVSAADMLNLLALIFTMFGELAVLTFGLWLLFRTTLPSVEFPNAADQD